MRVLSTCLVLWCLLSCDSAGAGEPVLVWDHSRLAAAPARLVVDRSRRWLIVRKGRQPVGGKQ